MQSPVDPVTHLAARARELSERYLHDEALEAVERALNERGNEPPPLWALAHGRALLGLNRFGAAKRALWAAVQASAITPTDRAEARYLYARSLLLSWGEVDWTIDLARLAAEQAERDGDAELVVRARGAAARAFARARAKGQAWKELEEASSFLGADRAAKNDLLLASWAAVDVDFDERPSALERYQQIDRATPRGRRLQGLGLAMLARLAGDFEQAHEHLDEAGAAGRCDLAPLEERTRLFYSQGRWADAIAAVESLLAISPASDRARFHREQRASALFRAGRRDEAGAAYRALLEESQDDRVGRSARRMAAAIADPARRNAKKRRIEGVKTVAQLRDHCGPACCELYVSYFGVSADQVEIARKIKQPGGGTPVYAMRRFLDEAGLATLRIEADLDTMRRLVDMDVPLIIEEEYSETRHVAVVIGYDDEREILEVQDPMSHEIRETPYEDLGRLLALANNGALIGVPKDDAAKLAELESAGIREARYIAVTDEAWRAFDEQRDDDARRLADEAIGLHRAYELAWICKFQLARRKGAEGAAELSQVLDTILELWPDDEWPQQYVGHTYYSQNRGADALRAYQKARDRDPSDGNNWAMIGDCLIDLGREAEAIEALAHALRRRPSHVRANENYASILVTRGELGRAAAINEIAREHNPKNPFNWEVLGRLCERRGDALAALAAYEKGFEVDPGRRYARAESARILASLGRVDEAAARMKELFDGSDRDLGVRIELADMYYRHGRRAEAIAVCDEISRASPDVPSAHAIRGAALAAEGKLDEGLAELRRALELRPAYPWAHFEMGQRLLEAKRHDEAVVAFAAATGLADSANNRFALADALALAGAKDAAASHMRRAAGSGAISEGQILRAADVIAEHEGWAPAREFLLDLEKRRNDPITVLRAHARFLVELGWMPHELAPVGARIAEIDPGDLWARACRARALFGQSLEADGEAEALLGAIVAERGDFRAPRVFLAEALVARGRHEEALSLLEPIDADWFFVVQRLRVEALLGLDRADEASGLVERNTSLSPPFVARLRYALARRREDFTMALQLAEELCRSGGSDEDDGRLDHWEIEKFRCLLALGEHERATSFGLKQCGTADDASHLANVALHRDALDVARVFAERALALDENDSWGLLTLARLAEVEGDDAKSRALLERAATAAPKNHAVPEAQARVALGDPSASLDEIASLAERAVGLYHLCDWAWTVHAEVALLRGDRMTAEADVARACALRDVHERHRPHEVTVLRAALAGDAENVRTERERLEATPLSARDRARLERLLSAIRGMRDVPPRN